MNETLFYVFGIGLAVSAVVFSLIALKVQSFPGKAFPLVVVWFLVLAGAATTFAVLHAQEEQEHKAAELEHAGKEIEKKEGSEPFEEEEAEQHADTEGGEEEGGSEAGGEAAGPGGTIELAADESALAYDTDSLESSAGEVTIDFTNPSSIGHDVAIEKDGEEITATEVITQGEDSATAELEPGSYTFFCSVPGHREAGMEGTLTVR
ncbi:MAG: cupredoxin domain-containing protein [Thermoleophilia bacterium]|nr:cupredoxin domain-containing protein [Thermoleophilia bacterium]